MSKEYKCHKCGAIHYYVFEKCSNCGRRSLVRRSKKPIYRKSRFIPSDDEQIGRLVAIIHSVKGTPHKNTKKFLLYHGLKGNKVLVKFFRVAYDPNVNFGFDFKDLDSADVEYPKNRTLSDFVSQKVSNEKSKLKAGRWLGLMRGYPVEFQDTLNGIVKGTFKLGINVNGINKVLQKLDLRPIPTKKKRKFDARTLKKKKRIHSNRRRR